MKTMNRLYLAALFGALTSAGLVAQTTPPGSPGTGTTNSGGVAPATGKPTTTPTGPTSGGTGSGVGNTVSGNTTTGNTTTSPGKSGGKGPNENASDTAKAVHEVIAKFQADRETYLAERRKLLDELKKATTEAERQKILEELRKDKQEREEDERNLGKQIREQLKTLREDRKSGGT